MEQYLCDPRDFKKLPRQWIINLIYTIVGQPFAEWVSERVEARNRKLVEEHDMAINLDPEIARCFEQATAVSSKSDLNHNHVSRFLTMPVYLSQPRRATPHSYSRLGQSGVARTPT